MATNMNIYIYMCIIYVVCSIYQNIFTSSSSLASLWRTPKHDVPAFNATWIGLPRISHRPLGPARGLFNKAGGADFGPKWGRKMGASY